MGQPSIDQNGRWISEFGVSARGNTQNNISARQIKKRWLRDGNSSSLQVLLAAAKRTANSPLACCQTPPQARQPLTHLTWCPHTQTRLFQSHCHTPPANGVRLSTHHGHTASCRHTAARADLTRTSPHSIIRKVVTFHFRFPYSLNSSLASVPF